MRRNWKLGCGASLEVVEIPNEEEDIFEVRIVGRPGSGWFARINNGLSSSGADVTLIVRQPAIPKLIKILQYLEKSVDKG